MKISGLILAGGLSRRLGRPKQNLPFADGTLLEHAIRQAEAVTEIDELVVVLPPGDDVPEPSTIRAHSVRHRQSDGCSGSLRAGLAALDHDLDAIVILPADQPGLSSDLIALAVRAWTCSRPPALTLRFRGEPGHPLVFSGALLDRLRQVHGEKGMWRLLEDLGEAVERVDLDIAAPADVDTWDDYQRVLTEPSTYVETIPHGDHTNSQATRV